MSLLGSGLVGGRLEVEGTRCYNSGIVMLLFQLILAEAHLEFFVKCEQFRANLFYWPLPPSHLRVLLPRGLLIASY